MNKVLELQAKMKESLLNTDTCDIEAIVTIIEDYGHIYNRILKKWLTSDIVKNNIEDMYNLQKTNGLRKTFKTSGLNLVCILDTYTSYVSEFKEFILDISDIEQTQIKFDDLQRKIDNLMMSDMDFINKLFDRETNNEHYTTNMDIGNVLTQLELIPSIISYMDGKELSTFVKNYNLTDGKYCPYKKKILWILIDSVFTYNGKMLNELLNIFNGAVEDIMKRDLVIKDTGDMKII